MNMLLPIKPLKVSYNNRGTMTRVLFYFYWLKGKTSLMREHYSRFM
jgi:hypothetical protein